MTRMLLETFQRQFTTSLAIQFQYRAAMFIWLLGAILEPVIYLVVWNTVAAVQGGAVGDYTAPQFAAYYIVLMVVNQLTFSWIMWEYEYMIRDGTLARRLMRPIHPIWNDIADNLAYKVLTSAVLVPTVIVLTLAFRPEFAVSWGSLLAFVPALLLAFVLRFTMEWTLAMAAFWTTRITAINQVYFVVFLFFSGRLAPLTLLPESVQAVAALLPFRWMLSFPLDLFLGRLGPAEILQGYVMQLLWTGAGLLLLRQVWRVGVRQFSAVGS